MTHALNPIDDTDYAELEVFADYLLAEGDLRGELLMLEIGAARASDSAECRRYNLEAQRWRDRCPELAWPEGIHAARVTTRGGFVTVADYGAVFGDAHSDELRRHLRVVHVDEPKVDEATIAALARARAQGTELERIEFGHAYGYTDISAIDAELFGGYAPRDRPPSLRELVIPTRRVHDAQHLADLEQLEILDISDTAIPRAEVEALAALPLRDLTWEPSGEDFGDLSAFASTLERVELFNVGALPKLDLPALRHLSLLREEPRPGVTALIEQLESLDLYHIGQDELAAVAASDIQRLTLYDLSAIELDDLLRCESVSDLTLHARADLDALSAMTWLRRLELSRGSGQLCLPPGLESLELNAKLAIVVELGAEPALRELSCTPEGWRSLPADCLEQLERLCLQLPSDFADAELFAQLPARCPSLRHIELRNDWTDPWARYELMLPELAKLPELTSLGIRGPVIDRRTLLATLPGVHDAGPHGMDRDPRSWPRLRMG